MKLLVDARPIVDPHMGGVSRVARALIFAYAETFPQDELICVTTGWRRPILPDALRLRPNVTHRHYRIPNKLWSIFAWLSSCVHCSLLTAHLSCDAIFLPNLGFIGALPQHIPTVLLLHDLSFLIEPRWFTWQQRLWHRAVRAQNLIRSATRLLAVSETTKQDAVRLFGIPTDRIAVIPIGPTLSAMLGVHEVFKTNGHYVLALGANDPRKNVATAIESVRELRMNEEFRDVTLTIVGASKRHDRMSLPEWIRTVTRPSDRELVKLYANAAAFLYPSWYEGYGLPLHEAAMFGTPCIASTSGALPETAPSGTLFANPAKPHEWVEALRMALTQPPRPPLLTNDSAWKEAATILREQTIDGPATLLNYHS